MLYKFNLQAFEESLSEKTIESLKFIAKDAHEAAIAMRGVDIAAECKYLDQLNAVTTELHRRSVSK